MELSPTSVSTEDEDVSVERLLGSSGLAGLYEARSSVFSRREQLSSATRELAFAHYPSFISVSESCTDIASGFSANRTRVEELLATRLPALEATSAVFKEQAAAVSQRRKRTSIVLSRHTRLLEVLELSQLVDTCVRNAHYEEALAIQQLAAKLNKSHGSIPLVQNVVTSIRTSLSWMLNQLMTKLKGPIQLPECLRIVGYIRRMGALSEMELRIKFLQAREAYFVSTIDSAMSKEENTYNSLCRVIELTRINVFDTQTQYRALFSDDDAPFASNTIISSPGSSSTVAPSSFRQIFPCWLNYRLAFFRDAVEEGLGKDDLDPQAAESLLGQIMYFGQSLGRVGFDFRSTFVPLFLDYSMQRAKNTLKSEIKYLESLLEKERSPLTHVLQEKVVLKIPGDEEEKQEVIAETGDHELLVPSSSALPKQLSSYPLAIMCNAVLTVINDMRYCSSLASVLMLKRLLKESVAAMGTILRQYKATVEATKSSSDMEKRISSEMTSEFADVLVPFVNRCFSVTIGQKANVTADFPLIHEEITA